MSDRSHRAPLQLTRRSLLGATGAAGLLWGVSAGAATRSDPKRLIVVFCNGGWDVTFVFDPKIGVGEIEGPEYRAGDEESVQTIHGIPLVVNEVRRPAVTDFFEQYGSRTAVVNGLHVGTIGHVTSRIRMLTGVGSAQPHPDLPTIVGATHGVDLPVGSIALSPYSLPGDLAATNARIGQRSQIAALLDPTAPIPVPAGLDWGDLPLNVTDATERAWIDAWRAERTEALRARWKGSRSAGRLDDLVASIDRAERLRGAGASLSEVLSLGVELDPGGAVELAVTLLQDRACHAIFLDSGHNWDTHLDNTTQHQNFDETFTMLSQLVASLEAHGMLDDTLVVVLSEMTRTPAHNATGGKDHWPFTSAMLIGGGTVGGQVLGATGDSLEPLAVDYETGAVDPAGEVLTFDAFHAGLLERLDVDPAEWLPLARPWRGGTV